MIRSAYEGILGREPAQAELEAWVSAIRAERLSSSQVLRRIASSDEGFRVQLGVHAEKVVDMVYTGLLSEAAPAAARKTLLEAVKRDPDLLVRTMRAVAWSPDGAEQIRAKALMPRWIFVHIPKTGGVSLLHWLKSVFPQREVGEFEIMVTKDHAMPVQAIPVLQSYQLISGHFSFIAAQAAIEGQKTYITVLREPSARVLSTYYFWKSYRSSFVQSSLEGTLAEGHIMSAKENNLADWLKTRNPRVLNEIDNAQVRYLTGLWIDDQGLDPLKEDPDAALMLAYENLDRCAAIGITERFDESMAWMARVMNKPVPDRVPRENVTALNTCSAHETMENVQKEPITEEIKALLSDMNRLDLLVYQRACQRLNAELQAATPSI